MCGVVGVLPAADRSNDSLSLLNHALAILDQSRNRGSDGTGILVRNNVGICSQRWLGAGKEIPADSYHRLQRWATKSPLELILGHVRYATVGKASIENVHPAIASQGKVRVAIVMNGEVSFTTAWWQDALRRGIDLGAAHTDSAACAGHILSRYLEERDPREALISFYKEAFPFGGFTILGLIEDEDRAYFFYLRDGLHPLHRVKIGSTWFFASETAHLGEVSAGHGERVRSVPAGEIGICSLTQHRRGALPQAPDFLTLDMNNELGGTSSKGMCAFEIAYFQRPDSLVHGRTIASVRKEFGRALCQDHPPLAGSVITSVPRSGISASQGYVEEARARALDVEMASDILQLNDEKRSFLENGPEAIARRLQRKFSLAPKRAQGKRTLVVDDSIVRGNFSAWLASAWHRQGGNGLSILSAWPPIIGPCHAGVDIHSSDLLAVKLLPVNEILRENSRLEEALHRGFYHPQFGRVEGVEFRYVSRERIHSVLGRVLEGKICTGCFDLHYNYIHHGNRQRPPEFLVRYMNENGVAFPGTKED